MAIYVRISQDREGAGLGVSRQEEDCRGLCARRDGWQVMGVYADNDVSAYSGKPRPEWIRLLADIAAGNVDAICCWHVDRLTRTPRELEDVIDLHDTAGIALATVTGEIDLSTPTGRMVARTLGAAARHESEHKAERQRRARLQAAQQGKAHSSGQRGYGYTASDMNLISDEAAAIAEAAARALAGEALGSVATDLNSRGIVTTEGKQWRVSTLRAVLTSARISGRREYYGEIIADATWPAIITAEQSDRLRAVLVQATQPRLRRTYLYTGHLHCGREECGRPLWGRHAEGKRRYNCVKAPGVPGCNRLSIGAEPAEAEIRDQVLAALESQAFMDRLLSASTGTTSPDEKAISEEIRAIGERRNELARDWAKREITRQEWAAARSELDEQLTTLTQALARDTHTLALAQFAAMDGDCWTRWETLTNGARRALVEATTDQIIIHPVKVRGRAAFDPGRIDIAWKA
ncbi:MAG TPA: recombinase family protein [Streptosporangiaceae bacterium]|nr:recombinase family protein [Streptosporangiaceae bacterium]